MERSQPKTGTRTVQHLEEIPTLLDVEKALRDLNDAKATGLDGLGAELFQTECAKAAKRIYPLVLKMGLRCQGIPELSGGSHAMGRTSRTLNRGFAPASPTLASERHHQKRITGTHLHRHQGSFLLCGQTNVD